jgi:tRNA(Ile)-lysidine synthase
VTRRREFEPAALGPALAAAEPNAGWVVAFSGGLDSTALLYALREARPEATLRAIHVDHGLHPDSSQWAAHCVAQARKLGVACGVTRLDPLDTGGQGLEAAARAARYAALEAELAAGEVLATAHHADDQAETVLLMALRGSGLAGLAAMPAVAPFGAGRLARPLLGFPRAALAAWAGARGLAWLDDPSNVDRGRDRNYLRHAILPGLRERWPAAASTLGRVARHAAEADALLGALADQDLGALVDGEGRLAADGLRALEPSRRSNAVRRWLDRAGLPAPPETKLDKIVSEMLEAAPDRRPLVAWPGAEVRRWRGRLYAGRPEPAPLEGEWRWDLRGALVLPDGSRLEARPGRGEGLDLPPGTPVTVRLRHGGERLKPAGHAHHRELKKLLAERGVPPWLRARVPLVYRESELVAVADLWIADGARATPGLALAWMRA